MVIVTISEELHAFDAFLIIFFSLIDISSGQNKFDLIIDFVS